MRLGLLGHPVAHSLSPELYKRFLGPRLASYELLDFSDAGAVPGLKILEQRFDGLNITTPYKGLFFEAVRVEAPVARAVKAINTLSFTPDGILGTNTDAIGVEEILRNFRRDFGMVHLIVLGAGAMAKVTVLTAEELSIPVINLTRAEFGDLTHMDLLPFRKEGFQNVVVNCCSRSFVFEGKLSQEDIFWDQNYSYPPHQASLPARVKLYLDGRELLERQALAAIRFWTETNSKLKC